MVLRRPYILETLTDDLEPVPDDWSEEHGCWCEKYGEASLTAFRQACPWLLSEQPPVSRFVLGATQRTGGKTRTRALIFATESDLERIKTDGENAVIRAPNNEIFCSQDDVFHVSEHEALLVGGTFAYDCLMTRDGEEVGADLRGFLWPKVIASIESRVKELVSIPGLVARHSKAVHQTAANLLEGLDLVQLNREDIDNLSMRVIDDVRGFLFTKSQANHRASRTAAGRSRKQNHGRRKGNA